MFNKRIEEAFSRLNENYSVAKSINFFENINQFDDTILFENAALFLYEPIRGVRECYKIISRYPFSKEELSNHLAEAMHVLEDCKANSKNDGHIKALESYVEDIQFLSNDVKTETLENLINEVSLKRFEPLSESETEILIKPINRALKTDDDSEAREIYSENNLCKCNDFGALFNSIPTIIEYIANIVISNVLAAKRAEEERIRTGKETVSSPYNDKLYNIMSYPRDLISFLLETDYIDEEKAHVLFRCLDGFMFNFFRRTKDLKHPVIDDFARMISETRHLVLRELAVDVNVKENVMAMKPIVGAEENEIEDEEEISSPTDESSHTSLFHISECCEFDIAKGDMRKVNPSYLEILHEEAVLRFGLKESTDVNEIIEDFVTLENLSIALEDIKKTAADISDKAHNMARKAGVVTHKGVEVAKRAGSGAASGVTSAEKAANNVIDTINKMDNDERRERIIRGGFVKKLLKIVREGILGYVLWNFKPVLAAIIMLGRIACNSRNDRNVRNDIVKELEGELRVVEEKIDDAKNSDDKEAKYKLLRAKNALEREISRIKAGSQGQIRNPELVSGSRASNMRR